MLVLIKPPVTQAKIFCVSRIKLWLKFNWKWLVLDVWCSQRLFWNLRLTYCRNFSESTQFTIETSSIKPIWPIQSMHGIFTYMWLIFVGKSGQIYHTGMVWIRWGEFAAPEGQLMLRVFVHWKFCVSHRRRLIKRADVQLLHQNPTINSGFLTAFISW